jgi:predicted GNAT superfamily acetyltransferase
MTDHRLFKIGPLTMPDDLPQVMEMQALVFGEQPINHVAMTTMQSYQFNGGHLLGAYENDQLFGFAIAYLGTYNRDPRRPAMANLKLVLERIAVHPDYRSIGLGSQLLRQLREMAVKQAVRLMTANFSPLNGRMANLLIRNLGAEIRYYWGNYFKEDVFGDYSTATAGQMIAEWWLTSNRVEERLFGNRAMLRLNQYLDAQTPIINPTTVEDDDLAVPYEKEPFIDGTPMILIEIPNDYDAMFQRDRVLAAEWKDHIQDVMQLAFGQGFVATDFLHEVHHNRLRSFYLLSYDGPGPGIELDSEG